MKKGLYTESFFRCFINLYILLSLYTIHITIRVNSKGFVRTHELTSSTILLYKEKRSKA